MEIIIVVAILVSVGLGLLPFVIRYFIRISHVKKNSQLYLEVVKLNEKYLPMFHVIQENHVANYVCNSLQKFKNNSNTQAIIKFLSGYVKEQESMWKDLSRKARSNENEYAKYITELQSLKQNLFGTSYGDIKEKTSLSEEKYKKYEEAVLMG